MILEYLTIGEKDMFFINREKERNSFKSNYEKNTKNRFFRIITYSPEFLCRTVHQFCGQ